MASGARDIHTEGGRLALRLAALTVAITATMPVACSDVTEFPGVTVITDDWVQHLCKAVARDCNQVDEIRKSSDGRELRVVFRDDVVVVSATAQVRAYRKPGLVAWMNDDHDWVAWSDDLKQGFYVQPESLRTHADGYPKFDFGGRFFAVTQGNETRLYRVSPHRHEATLPLRFVSGVFSNPPLVFIFGPDRETRRLHMYTYRDAERGVEFVASRVIERPNGGTSSPFYVSDVAASGELVTIHDVYDPPLAFMSTVRVYESTAGGLRRLRTGYLPWATLFLSEELRRRINSDAPFTLTPSTSSGDSGKDR